MEFNLFRFEFVAHRFQIANVEPYQSISAPFGSSVILIFVSAYLLFDRMQRYNGTLFQKLYPVICLLLLFHSKHVAIKIDGFFHVLNQKDNRTYSSEHSDQTTIRHVGYKNSKNLTKDLGLLQ